jgi:hypothetical protein
MNLAQSSGTGEVLSLLLGAWLLQSLLYECDVFGWVVGATEVRESLMVSCSKVTLSGA